MVKLTAVCMECFREAAYTKRLGSEKEVAPTCLPGGAGWGEAGRRRAPPQSAPSASRGQVEVIGGADKYHSVCRLCYFKKAAGLPAAPDGKENKENCPVPVPARPAEAAGARKLFAPHQVLQCSPAN